MASLGRPFRLTMFLSMAMSIHSLASPQLLFGLPLTSSLYFVSLDGTLSSFLRVTAVNYFFYSPLPPGVFTLCFICHNIAQLSRSLKILLKFLAIHSIFDMLQ